MGWVCIGRLGVGANLGILGGICLDCVAFVWKQDRRLCPIVMGYD